MNYEHLQAQDEEMANQNAYLRRQLGGFMRQGRRDIRSSSSSIPSDSVRGEREEDERQTSGSSSDGVHLDIQGEGEDTNLTSMTLESTFRSLKAS